MAQAKPAMGVSRTAEARSSASRAADAALKPAAARPAFLGKSVKARAAAFSRRSNGAPLRTVSKRHAEDAPSPRPLCVGETRHPRRAWCEGRLPPITVRWPKAGPYARSAWCP